jgi:hypothetical protein
MVFIQKIRIAQSHPDLSRMTLFFISPSKNLRLISDFFCGNLRENGEKVSSRIRHRPFPILPQITAEKVADKAQIL